jgi:hypothetical protein
LVRRSEADVPLSEVRVESTSTYDASGRWKRCVVLRWVSSIASGVPRTTLRSTFAYAMKLRPPNRVLASRPPTSALERSDGTVSSRSTKVRLEPSVVLPPGDSRTTRATP